MEPYSRGITVVFVSAILAHLRHVNTCRIVFPSAMRADRDQAIWTLQTSQIGVASPSIERLSNSTATPFRVGNYSISPCNQ
jgi:hypothetical protein